MDGNLEHFLDHKKKIELAENGFLEGIKKSRSLGFQEQCMVGNFFLGFL